VLIDCGDTIQGTPLEYVYQTYARAGRLPLGLQWTGAPPACRSHDARHEPAGLRRHGPGKS
jgi:hypothetical protein